MVIPQSTIVYNIVSTAIKSDFFQTDANITVSSFNRFYFTKFAVFRIKIIQVCILPARASDRYFGWEVVFDGTAPEKTGPNFKGPCKYFRHQIII